MKIRSNLSSPKAAYQIFMQLLLRPHFTRTPCLKLFRQMLRLPLLESTAVKVEHPNRRLVGLFAVWPNSSFVVFLFLVCCCFIFTFASLLVPCDFCLICVPPSVLIIFWPRCLPLDRNLTYLERIVALNSCCSVVSCASSKLPKDGLAAARTAHLRSKGTALLDACLRLRQPKQHGMRGHVDLSSLQH